MAVEAAALGRVARFSATERVLHAVHATAFGLMLASGLVLFVPRLSALVGDRPLVKGIHVGVAIAWLCALALIGLLGDGPRLRRTWRQFEHLDGDDVRWLRTSAGRRQPQGRFNAGQKVHGLAQAALAILFVVSGALLLLGEREHSLRVDGALPLHDLATLVATAFVAGHVWMALTPPTSAALRGMIDGTVPERYAHSHHGAWDPAAEPPDRRPAITAPRVVAAAVIAAAGVALALLVL